MGVARAAWLVCSPPRPAACWAGGQSGTGHRAWGRRAERDGARGHGLAWCLNGQAAGAQLVFAEERAGGEVEGHGAVRLGAVPGEGEALPPTQRVAPAVDRGAQFQDVRVIRLVDFSQRGQAAGDVVCQQQRGGVVHLERCGHVLPNGEARFR